ELWAAFEELALRPDDRASRRQVLSTLDSLAARVNSVAGGLEILERDTVGSLQQAVHEANGLFDRLADLNRSILDATSGAGSPNDLLDERDLAIDQLSRLVGAQTTVEDNGTVRVSVSGMEVVGGTRATHLSVATAEDGTHVVRHATGVDVRAGGEVGGMQAFLNQTPSLTDRLEGFVQGLVDVLNVQHAEGYNTKGERDVALLTYSDAPGRRILSVLVTDPDDLAAAAEPGGTHDGRNATALAALRTSGLDGQLRGIVTEHAAEVAAGQRAARGQRQLTAAASSAREGVHGVSLDEEMVAMLNYQRALEASSRMMSAVDQALDTIINRTGLVGR
ncbi:MAG: flagellar hook-associated protein FlgK, partial [Actinobacteria bacterium]|nr:flagellar hook-associated protein FlgK [Actinomycetota bacterium]